MSNKRANRTSYSLKDVFVVLGAMMTAVTPLVTNDYRVYNNEQDVSIVKEDIKDVKGRQRDDEKALDDLKSKEINDKANTDKDISHLYDEVNKHKQHR